MKSHCIQCHTDSDMKSHRKSYQVQFSLGGSLLEGRRTVNSTKGKLRMHKRYTHVQHIHSSCEHQTHTNNTTWQLHAQRTRLGLERELVITEKRKKECVRKECHRSWEGGLDFRSYHRGRALGMFSWL